MSAVRYIPAGLRRAVLESGPCAYCGEPFPNEVDHVLPVSRGGTSDPENLAPACRPCNEQKLDFTPDEWREWRESIGLEWPPKSRWDRAREFLDAELAKLTPEEQAEVHEGLRAWSRRLDDDQAA